MHQCFFPFFLLSPFIVQIVIFLVLVTYQLRKIKMSPLDGILIVFTDLFNHSFL